MGVFNVKLFDPDRSEFWLLIEGLLALVVLGLGVRYFPEVMQFGIPAEALAFLGLQGLEDAANIQGVLTLFVIGSLGYAWARMHSKDRELNPKKFVQNLPKRKSLSSPNPRGR